MILQYDTCTNIKQICEDAIGVTSKLGYIWHTPGPEC